MRRVVVLGPGGAGKSVLARRLSASTGAPVIELDALFWQPGLEPTSRDRWAAMQADLARRDAWIMDGDLGPYDVVGPRLDRADTVVLLDFGVLRCGWRALRRGRRRLDFWRWLLSWRRRYRPALLEEVARHAPGAEVRVLRAPRQVRAFLDEVALG